MFEGKKGGADHSLVVGSKDHTLHTFTLGHPLPHIYILLLINRPK